MELGVLVILRGYLACSMAGLANDLCRGNGIMLMNLDIQTGRVG